MNVKLRNDYLEDVSMGLIEHKTAFIETATVEITTSATDVIDYDVPAGSQLVLNHIDFSKGADEAIVVSLTIDDVEQAAWTTMTSGEADLNGLKVAGGETLKVVGTGSSTGNMSVNVYGVLIKTNSVPVDVSNFTATAGNEEIALEWDEQTSEDFKAFEIEWTSDGYGHGIVTIEESDATDYTITGLENGVEYTITNTWYGYDNATGTPAEATATPTIMTPTSFTATGEDANVALAWTDTSSKETGIEIWRSLETGTGFELIHTTDPDVESYDDDDVENDTEYFYKIRFVTPQGDGPFTAEKNATPSEPVTGTIAIGSHAAFNGSVTDSAYSLSTDEGATWTAKTALSSFAMTSVAGVGAKVVAVFDDPSEVADSQFGTTEDGTSWTYDTSENWSQVQMVGDLAIREGASSFESSTDGTTWTSITGATTIKSAEGVGGQDGTNYFFIGDSQDVYSSSDGVAFSALTAQPTLTPANMAGVDGLLVVAAGEATTAPTYEYSTDDGSTWTSGTSSITATEGSMNAMVGVGDTIYSIFLEDDLSASYIEKTTDGSTWTAVSNPGSYLAYKIGADGTSAYVGLVDAGGDGKSYISVDSGSGFGTPVEVIDDSGDTLIFIIGGVS